MHDLINAIAEGSLKDSRKCKNPCGNGNRRYAVWTSEEKRMCS